MRSLDPLRIWAVIGFVGLASTTLSADRYSVNVRRIESNLYQDTGSKTIIETRYCYHYTYGEEGILNWEGRYGNNWLLFIDSTTKCNVVAIR
jgi:hypothetical protein